jgi:CheY-specific phosphatase CheX
MSNPYLQAMDHAFQETMNDVCFLDAQPATQWLKDGISQVLFIRIMEPFSGSLELSFPLELKRRIIENIHNQNWSEISPKTIDDTFLEILNILTGKFLDNYTQNKASYLIGLPVINYEKIADPPNNQLYLFHYDVEGLIAEVRLMIQGGG